MAESFAILNNMRNTCLTFIKQGWFGLPLFFLGLGSLAFSQLEPGQDANELTADQIASTLSADLSKARDLIKTLQKDVQLQLAKSIAILKSDFHRILPKLQTLINLIPSSKI